MDETYHADVLEAAKKRDRALSQLCWAHSELDHGPDKMCFNRPSEACPLDLCELHCFEIHVHKEKTMPEEIGC